jgi:Cof subfamily protein (haloacid dehalogenase superfamily)
MNNLYISDLDKTLLQTDLTVSNFTKNIWNSLTDRGIKLTIATARSGIKSLELLKDLNLQHPMIVMDGAMIISNRGDIILSHSLDEDIAGEILQIGKRYEIEPFFIGVDDKGIERFLYPDKLNSLQQQLIDEYKKDKRLKNNLKHSPLRENVKTVYIGDKEPLETLKDELSETFGKNIEIKFSKDPYLDGYFLTLLHPKGDKAHALRELCQLDEFKNLEITVFGDSHNDIGMFELAKNKIAVANALEDVKKIATHILPHSNDEDAVAKYLNQKYIHL